MQRHKCLRVIKKGRIYKSTGFGVRLSFFHVDCCSNLMSNAGNCLPENDHGRIDGSYPKRVSLTSLSIF